MVDQKLIDMPVFAFFLPTASGQDGELVFGGIDQSHYTGDLVDVPLTSETYWQVSLDSMTLGSTPVTCSPARRTRCRPWPSRLVPSPSWARSTRSIAARS